MAEKIIYLNANATQVHKVAEQVKKDLKDIEKVGKKSFRELAKAAGKFTVKSFNTKDINKGLRSIQGELKAVASQSTISARDINRAFGGIARKAFIGITLPLVALTGHMVNSTTKADEMRNRFNVVFGDVADDAYDFSKNFASSIGRTVIPIQEAMAAMQDLSTGFGMTTQAASEFSKAAVRIGYDIASFTNRADVDVMKAIQSAVMGNHRAIRDYGVALTVASINETLRLHGLQKMYHQLSENQKMEARLLTIIQQSPNAIGDAARTYLSFANQLKLVKDNLLAISVSFGQVVQKALQIPIIYFNMILQSISHLDDGLKINIMSWLILTAILPVVALAFHKIFNLGFFVYSMLANLVGIIKVAIASFLSMAISALTLDFTFKAILFSVMKLVSGLLILVAVISMVLCMGDKLKGVLSGIQKSIAGFLTKGFNSESLGITPPDVQQKGLGGDFAPGSEFDEDPYDIIDNDSLEKSDELIDDVTDKVEKLNNIGGLDELYQLPEEAADTLDGAGLGDIEGFDAMGVQSLGISWDDFMGSDPVQKEVEMILAEVPELADLPTDIIGFLDMIKEKILDIPLVSKVLDWWENSEAVKSFKETFDGLWTSIKKAGLDLLKFLGLWDTELSLEENLDNILEKVEKALKKLQEFIQYAIDNPAVVALTVGSLILGAVALDVFFLALKTAFKAKLLAWITGGGLVAALAAVGKFLLGIVAFIAGSIPIMLALVFGFLVIAWTQNWFGLQKHVDESWEWLKNSFNWLKDTISEIWTSFCDGITEIWNKFWDSLAEFLVTWIDNIVGFVTGLWKGLVSIITSIKDTVSEIWTSFWEYLGGLVTYWKDKIVTFFTELRDSVVKKATEIKDWVLAKFEELKTAAVNKVTEIKDGIVQGFTNMLTSITTKATEIKNAVVKVFDELVGMGFKWGKGLIGGFIEGITNMVDKVGEGVGKITGKIKGLLEFNSPAEEGDGRFIEVWGGNMVKGFVDGMKTQIGLVAETSGLMSYTVGQSFQNTDMFKATGSAISGVSESSGFSQASQGDVTLQVGVLVADKQGLRQLERQLAEFREGERNRVGGVLV